MKKYVKNEKGQIYRILEEKENVLIVSCGGNSLPKWENADSILNWQEAEKPSLPIGDPTPDDYCQMNQRFNIIADILSVLGNKRERSRLIEKVSAEYHISRTAICGYINLYLTYDCKEALLPQRKEKVTELTKFQKDIRWGLNKFYYTPAKHSLKDSYKMLLEARYFENGKLADTFPTFHQFRYYYRKHNRVSNEIISRYGMSYYKRNERPLLGDGIQELAKGIGTGMLDSTICDIYLINDAGQIIGRPILTACVDAYSGLCCGYSLGWEGGTYSLRNLMLNVIADKVEYCRKLGIGIDESDWASSSLPARLITDQGREYVSQNFDQLAELGCTIINLSPYMANDKGMVEKFFDMIQETYKPMLKGKGVIEDDFQERGAEDYRRQACLTLSDFEKIIVRTIVFYNSKRLVGNFPYTEAMIKANVKPFASCIWNWGMAQPEANLIETDAERLTLTLLPRTTAHFTRKGLIVNKMRYKHPDYQEQYLSGMEVTVAYNPDSSDKVWLLAKGCYVPFTLIESRYAGKTVEETITMKSEQKDIIRQEEQEALRAEISLMQEIRTIADCSGAKKRYISDAEAIRNIRENRNIEKKKMHKKLEVS